MSRGAIGHDGTCARCAGGAGRAPSQGHVSDMAILLAMSAEEHVALADAKNRLSEVIDRVEREHGRVVITKYGRPAAVVLSVADLESLEETLGILSDPELVREIRRSESDIRSGRAERLTREDVLGRIKPS